MSKLQRKIQRARPMKIEIVQFRDGSYAVRKESKFLFWSIYGWLSTFNVWSTEPYFCLNKDKANRYSSVEEAKVQLKVYYLNKEAEKDQGTPIKE
jgi:hypothetical protein